MEEIVLVGEKILNGKIGLKNSKSENRCEKIGSRKKNLGQKVSVKNFSWKMEKMYYHEKVLCQKIGEKNLSWKMDEKNWSSRWKNSRSENRREKFWLKNRL